MQELDFGARMADVNYFQALPARRPQHRLFLCL